MTFLPNPQRATSIVTILITTVVSLGLMYPLMATASAEEANIPPKNTAPRDLAQPTCIETLIGDAVGTSLSVQPQSAVSNDHQKRLEVVSRFNEGTFDDTFSERFRAEVLESFQTIRIFPGPTQFPNNAKLRVVFLHGGAMSYSQAASMRQALYLFADQSDKYSSTSLAKPIRNLPKDPNYKLSGDLSENEKLFVPIAAEAPDLPFHGVGSRDMNLVKLAAFRNYMVRYFQMVKSETPNLKTIVFTRSSSAPIALEVLKQAPELIDGLILMSPTKPEPELLEKAKLGLYEMARKGIASVNPEGMEFIINILNQTTWDENSLRNKPTLILTGQADPEVQPGEIEFFRAMAAQSPNVQHLIIPGAKHDVFRTAKPEPGDTINPPYKEKNVLATARVVEEFFRKFIDSD